jgi:hypothetical protein
VVPFAAIGNPPHQAASSLQMVNPKYKNYLLVLLGLTTIAGGFFAWNQYQELIRLRADSFSDSARADLQKRLWTIEKRKNELEAELASLRARRAAAIVGAEGDPAAEDPSAPGRPGPGQFNRRSGMSNLATLLDNPELSKLWNAQQKFGLDARYAALFKDLNLSPADLDKFKSLLVEKQNAILDVMAAGREQGLNPRDPTDRAQLATLLQTAQAQVDNNILQTLGAGQYAQYQNYEQTLPQRSVVSQLAQSLSYSGSPLQDAQAQQLVNILAANAPAPRQWTSGGGGLFAAVGGGGGPMAGIFGNRAAPITDAAVTQAGAILTAPQVTALQQLQSQQQAQQQIAKILRQANASGSTASAAPATQGGASPPPAPPTPPGG